MIGAIVNTLSVIIGSTLGLFFGSRLQEHHTVTITHGLSIVVLVLGISSAIQTGDALTMIICLVLGIILGELLRIEHRLDQLGNFLRSRFAGSKSASTFTEGFVSASLLMCIGPMSIMGSLEAGLDHNYAILFSKSAIDFFIAVTFSATMGVGVAFAALPIFVYEGCITLLASFVSPYLSTTVITEMSAVGGILQMCTGINMLRSGSTQIKVGNMLPAILLPIVYVPVANWLTSLF